MDHPRNKGKIEYARKLRREMTKEERHLWYDFLCKYPIRFRRQEIIENYIVDFYCHKAKLAVELDGSQHFEESGRAKDKLRSEKIEKRDFTVIRIPNNEINENFAGVCEYIDLTVKKTLKGE